MLAHLEMAKTASGNDQETRFIEDLVGIWKFARAKERARARARARQHKSQRKSETYLMYIEMKHVSCSDMKDVGPYAASRKRQESQHKCERKSQNYQHKSERKRQHKSERKSQS